MTGAPPRLAATVAFAVVLSAGVAFGEQAADRAPSGVGEVRFANSGAPAAQAPFLEGLAQLHNFEYESAAALFRRAQALDPGFAMAYWGEAMTYNHPVWMQQDRAAALTALARLGATPAARAAKAPTAREKAYLGAVEILYGVGEKYARDFAYSDAMAELYHQFPDDPDAAAFYALSLLGTAHAGRDLAVYMRAAAVLEPVFRKYPHHPGAAHYLIHSYDDPIHAPLGLLAARAYSKIAPSAAHAQHMCSHIFVAMGLWDDVVAANEAATRVMNAAQAAAGRPARPCGHYPFWLEYGYLEQGRFADAKRVLSACYADAMAESRPRGAAAFDPDDSRVGSFAAMRARYLIDTEDWEGEVVGWLPSADGRPAAQVTLAFATGFAQARSGHTDAARASLDALRTARRALDAQLANAPTSDQSYGARAKILDEQLSALVEIAAGAPEPAIETLEAAASAEEKMPFEFGPPAVDKPSYELVGEVLLADGRAADARAAFEKALARTPRRTTVMLGLMRAAAAAGDAKKAASVEAELREIWRRADHPMTPRAAPAVDRNALAAEVRTEFLHAWHGYETYAWGHDDLLPVSRSWRDWYGDGQTLDMTPVDALDTMLVMGLTDEAAKTRQLIDDRLSFDKDISVSNFEITIRLLGGLLSAHQLTKDPRLLALAKDLGTRLMPAFQSPTGMPYRFVNLKTGAVSGAVSNPAEIGTLILEFGTLSKLTGTPAFYNAAKRALVELHSRRSKTTGLVGGSINVETGEWMDATSHIGGGIDSYYEYLLKCDRLFGDPDCRSMWRDSVAAINKYLADDRPGGLWYGEADMNTGQRTGTTFGSLQAFLPAVLALGGDLDRARRLQASSFRMWTLNGIEPEEIDYQTMRVVRPGYQLRPEIVESAYYLSHYTGDPRYLEMGRTIFEDLRKYCRTDDGYTVLKDVVSKEQGDLMHSFFLAETLKYLYLLFKPDALDFDHVVFNTEAHPLAKTW